MTKFLTLVFILTASVFSTSIFAQDTTALQAALTTKKLVRMKLWYEGLEDNKVDSKGINTEKQAPMPEELSRALSKLKL